MSELSGVAAIVLAGGAARRFGGADKLRHVVAGRPVLARVLDALREVGVGEVVVVGPPRPGVDDGCIVVREDPPGAGPLAGLAAGVHALGETSPTAVFVLAGDLPYLDGGALRELADAFIARPGVDAVYALDERDRVQELFALWNAVALRRAIAAVGDVRGGAVRALRPLVTSMNVQLTRLPGCPAPWHDLDVQGPSARPAPRDTGP